MSYVGEYGRSRAWKTSRQRYEVYRESWRKWSVHVFPEDGPASIESNHGSLKAAQARREELCMKLFNELLKKSKP